MEKSTDNITYNGWQTYSFKIGWAGIKMLDMNLKHAIDVDENMKVEVLEAGLSEADRQKILDSKARFIQYINYYYGNITCRGDGIPNLIKL